MPRHAGPRTVDDILSDAFNYNDEPDTPLGVACDDFLLLREAGAEVVAAVLPENDDDGVTVELKFCGQRFCCWFAGLPVPVAVC